MYGAGGASGSSLPAPAWTRRTPSHTRTLDRAAVIARAIQPNRFVVFMGVLSVGGEDNRGEREGSAGPDTRPRVIGIAVAPAGVRVGLPAAGNPLPAQVVARLPHILHRELHPLG